MWHLISLCTDFQSPQHRGCSRYTGLANGDSPGDVEPSQDIIWDSTSPTQTHTGKQHRHSAQTCWHISSAGSK